MLMFAPIFILFSPIWFVLVFVASCLIIAAIDNDRGWLATVPLIATVVLMTCFGTLPLIEWVRDHGWWTLGIIAGWFLIGGPFGGIARWITFVHDEMEKYEIFRIKWLQKNGVNNGEVPDALKSRFLFDAVYLFHWIKIDRNTGEIIQSHPLAWQNKSRIVTWMTYWPWTLVWLVLDDVVTRWFKIVQRKLSAFMDEISRKIFSRYSGDFDLPVPKPKVPEIPKEELLETDRI